MTNATFRAHAVATLNLIHDFQLSWGGEPVTMSPSSQRLVGFIAVHDRPVRRTKVSGSLWLNSSEERAKASLRSALWRVPSLNGFSVLSSSPTHLWLNPAVEVDFRSVITRAYGLFDEDVADHAVVDVARELCSFGDDLLPGWYDDWVIMERERFHHLRLQALDRLGETLLRRRRFGDALQVGLAAVQAEPLHETAHRLLMSVHLDQGNIAEAVHQFERYERALAQEVGAAPSMAMRQLLDLCLDHTGRPHSDQQVEVRRRPPDTDARGTERYGRLRLGSNREAASRAGVFATAERPCTS